MGLSDEERLEGMYGSLRELSEISKRWKEDYQVESYYRNDFVVVRDLVDQLWHAFLGKQSNSIHWIMGSSTSNTITHSPHTPWDMAVCHHLSDAIREKCDWAMEDSERPFDAMRFTSLVSLVKHGDRGTALGYVVEIYQWIEQLIYYMRRYPDEFLEGYKEVSEITSKIMGECFVIFSRREDVAKAYLIREIMDILYVSPYPYRKEEWDVVVQFMSGDCTHHDMSNLMKWDIKDLAKEHITLVKAVTKARRKAEDRREFQDDPDLIKARLFFVLKVSHGLHEYKHKREDLYKILEGHKLLPKVKKEVDRLVAEYEKDKKEVKEKRDDDDWDMKQLEAYPWEGYRILSDFLDEEGLHPRQEQKDEFKARRKADAKKIKAARAKKAKKKAKKKAPKKVATVKAVADRIRAKKKAKAKKKKPSKKVNRLE
jgi:hypothetical protein